VAVLGAFLGAILGVLGAHAVYSAFIALPIIPVDDPERRLAQGIGRTIDELPALLTGLVLGTIIGGVMAGLLIKWIMAASGRSATDALNGG